MMDYTAMRQKKPVIRDSAEMKRKTEVVPSSEEHVRGSEFRDLRVALEEIRHLKESNAKVRQFTAVVSHDLQERLRTMSAA